MWAVASIAAAASVLSPGANVLVVGSGPICTCAVKLAAMRGYSTTALMFPTECESGPELIYDAKMEKDSLPITFMPIAGPDASEEQIEAVAAKAEGLILAIDDQKCFGAPVIETFFRPGGALKRVALMSRYLNGKDMGFFAKSAKYAANRDIWDAEPKVVASYRDMEKVVVDKATAVGAEHTIIRAGTLKGGAIGSSSDGGGGEPSLLSPAFYKLGQQDVANWRLVYDCENLAVGLTRGDTLPGPGKTAVFTATDRLGPGDSHRGAVAASLVEALRSPAAANLDFSVVSGARTPNNLTQTRPTAHIPTRAMTWRACVSGGRGWPELPDRGRVGEQIRRGWQGVSSRRHEFAERGAAYIRRGSAVWH